MTMAKKVPKCDECILCAKEKMTAHGMERDYCHHSAWRSMIMVAKWIKSTAKRKTSPKWCPLRPQNTKGG